MLKGSILAGALSGVLASAAMLSGFALLHEGPTPMPRGGAKEVSTEAPKALPSRDLDALRDRLAILEAQLTPVRQGKEALKEGTAAIRQELELQPRTPPVPAAAHASPADFEKVMARLLDPTLPSERGHADGERAELWEHLREAGLLDQAVAAFVQRAKERSKDPDAQVDAGLAFLKKQDAVQGAAQGRWAIKADQAFDAALALDEGHWKARYTKAMAMSHWPSVYGMQGEAIRHLTILAEQQRRLSQQPEFADTYFFLGNLYQQQGEKEKAIKAWQEGYSQFPDNPALKQKAGNP